MQTILPNNEAPLKVFKSWLFIHFIWVTNPARFIVLYCIEFRMNLQDLVFKNLQAAIKQGFFIVNIGVAYWRWNSIIIIIESIWKNRCYVRHSIPRILFLTPNCSSAAGWCSNMQHLKNSETGIWQLHDFQPLDSAEKCKEYWLFQIKHYLIQCGDSRQQVIVARQKNVCSGAKKLAGEGKH